MLKILHAGCFGLSPAISSQFTVELCAAAKNCKKKFTDVDKAKKHVTSACYDMQQVCTYLQPFSHCKSQ